MAVAAALTTALSGQAPFGSSRRPPDLPTSEPSLRQAGTAPAGALSARNANYTIDVTLDPSNRTLKGHELVTWRNTTSVPTAELQFHLYYNAWKNTRSTWMRERALGSRGQLDRRPPEDWSWIEVTDIRLVRGGPVDLTHRTRYISPDDGNADDQTVMAVALPEPIGPGEVVTLELVWNSKIPRTFARTGAIGKFYLVAQWFPKLGVLEETGWNCHQFHGATEFYSDYGVYDVSMTVPRGWVLGATGLEGERRENGDGTTTHRYVQADVHDFAWTTSPDYVERRARFEHPTLPPVDMRLLLQPEHAGQADRHFEATRTALRYYGEWFGPYPYGHITIVDPAFQSNADGMEYPTLFTAGTRWLIRKGVTEPESVTVHEAGHQFWYGIVGSNEFEHAWLDEGLNTFSTARVIEQAYQPNFFVRRFFGGFVPHVFRDIRLSRNVDGDRLASYRFAAKTDEPAKPTYRYWPPAASAISYAKTALWMHTLERLIGWPTLRRILSTYFARWQFRHPRPQDFFDVANEVSGQDLTWFFDQVYRSSNVVDYAIAELTSEPVDMRGYVTRATGPQFVESRSAGRLFHTVVVVRRYGEAIFPVDVAVTFAGGEAVRERWDGRDRWKLFVYDRPYRADAARVDPERSLLLDMNYTNNSKSLHPRSKAAATKWMLTWMAWLEDLMLTYGLFV